MDNCLHLQGKLCKQVITIQDIMNKKYFSALCAAVFSVGGVVPQVAEAVPYLGRQWLV